MERNKHIQGAYYAEKAMTAFLFAVTCSIALYAFIYMPGYNGFEISDWMINYQGGFVRRGLVGELLFMLEKVKPYNLRYAVIGIDTLLTQASKVLFGRVVEPEIDVRAGEGTGDFEVDLGFRVDAGKARCAALAGEPFYADPQPDVVLRALGFVAIKRSPEELAALPEGWCDGLVALMLRLGGRQPEKIYLTGKNVDIDVGHEAIFIFALGCRVKYVFVIHISLHFPSFLHFHLSPVRGHLQYVAKC